MAIRQDEELPRLAELDFHPLQSRMQVQELGAETEVGVPYYLQGPLG